ncbi:MAG: hypothetical protein ACREAX_03750 [Candidatus Nitrosotenuis sp.]
MNYNKALFVGLIVLVTAFVIYYVMNQDLATKTDPTFETQINRAELPIEGSLFKVLVKQHNIQVNFESKTVTYSGADFDLKPELMELYYKIGLLNQTQNSVVVYPVFTESAYSKNGFYDYYNNKCDISCLTVKIPDNFNGEYSASRSAFNSLRLLGYQYITDVDVDKDPDVLKKYDKVILLHNEYVSEKEFDAITKHPKVIYLYPNALYAEITTNYVNNVITLVRGHGYPSSEIGNGFGWEFDNTNLEYDNKCVSWKFYEIDNGIMMNCYPEYIIYRDPILLQKIKDY